MTERRQQIVLWSVAIAVAATRVMAMAHSLWDWDEALFCSAMRQYDVASHHPHPPGFPLFIALGHLMRLIVHDDFRALRDLNLVFASLTFPVAYLLGRALRMEALTAAVAALFYAFLPNVWFYGGTAFSDIGGAVTTLGAAAALLYARHDDRAWLAGSLLLGASIAFRPQNVLLALYPWLAAAWGRIRTRRIINLIGGAAITIAIAAAFYGGSILITGPSRYFGALRDHSTYLMQIDSYRNPDRPPIPSLMYEFLVAPYHGGRTAMVFGVLALLGLLRGRRAALEAVAIFAPFAVFMLLLLDVNSTSRYSIAYVPLLALLAAEGTRWISTLGRTEGQRSLVQWLVVAVMLAGLLRFTAPELDEVRRHDSPPVQAIAWIRAHLDPRTTTLYVHSTMEPFTNYLLPDRRWQEVGEDFGPSAEHTSGQSWLLIEDYVAGPDAVNFTRPHDRLWSMARDRYFEVAVEPVADMVKFGAGWHEEEGVGTVRWHWMKREGDIELAPIRGRANLFVRWRVPLDAEPHPPVVTFALNGKVIDRVISDRTEMERAWVVPSNGSATNRLHIAVDQSVRPAGDKREIALRLDAISWKGAP